MVDRIRDFIESWRKYDDSKDSRVPAWEYRFTDAGYHSVKIAKINNYPRIQEWLDKNIEDGHYAWTGQNMFWFDREEDATLFKLRWSS